MGFITEIMHMLKYLLLALQGRPPAPSPPPPPIKEVGREAKEVMQEIKEEFEEEILEMVHTPDVGILSTKEQRIRRILNLILDKILVQKYKDPESYELNPIHPEYEMYILTVGAGMASELTEQRIQQLALAKGYVYAESYCYVALSAPWRRKYKMLIEEAGKKIKGDRGEIIRARLHELWRQTVWADANYAKHFLFEHGISDAELEEFLFALAEDNVEFLPKKDKPR